MNTLTRTRIGSISTARAALLLLFAGAVCAQDSAMPRMESPEGARTYIISPADGEIVSSPFKVRFGLQGMGVAPAGITNPNTGHHHLLIDVATMPAFTQPLPANDNFVHFGGGQTETTLDLAPGRHTLQLVLGDAAHVPHDPPVMSERITITVSAD